MARSLAVWIGALVLLAAPAIAQSLQELPFDKQLKLAKVGDVDAQYAVGLAYEAGKGTNLSEAEAAKWFRQSALQGNVEAQYHLAKLVAKGAKGLKPDVNTAFKLYHDAADKGHVAAMNALGKAYQSGRGTKADPLKAAEWYGKAAEMKLADAENNLGMLYLEGKGVSRDLSAAFRYFERAAAQNDPWGLNNLGGLYEMGWGTVADRDKALDLYKRALAAGNAQAQQNVDRLTGTRPPDAAAQ